MQPYEGITAAYPPGPGLLGMPPHPSLMPPHLYLSRPLPTPYLHPLPPHMHPFTLAERLAGK